MADDGGHRRHAGATLRRPTRRRKHRTAALLYGGRRFDLFGQIITDTGRFQYIQIVEFQACGVYRVDFVFAVFVALGGVGDDALHLYGRAASACCIGTGCHHHAAVVGVVLLFCGNTGAEGKEFYDGKIQMEHGGLFRATDSRDSLPDDRQTRRV